MSYSQRIVAPELRTLATQQRKIAEQREEYPHL